VQDIKDLTPARGQDGKISDIQGKDFWSPTRESGGRLRVYTLQKIGKPNNLIV
jgi:hypothetical protein